MLAMKDRVDDDEAALVVQKLPRRGDLHRSLPSCTRQEGVHAERVDRVHTPRDWWQRAFDASEDVLSPDLTRRVRKPYAPEGRRMPRQGGDELLKVVLGLGEIDRA